MTAILTDQYSKIKQHQPHTASSSIETGDASCSTLVRLLSRWITTLTSLLSSSTMHVSISSTLIIIFSFLLRVSYRLKSLKLIEPLLVRLDAVLPTTSGASAILNVAPFTSPLDCLIYLYFRGKIYTNERHCWPLALNAFDESLKFLKMSKKQPSTPSFIERRIFIYMTTLRYLLNLSAPTQMTLQYYSLATELAPFFLKGSSWIPPTILLNFDTLYFTCMVEAKFRFILAILKKWRSIEGDSFSFRVPYDQLFTLLQRLLSSSSHNYSGYGFVNSTEELEALLANMIQTGSIKGYLSHEKATMVLSKKNPFPSDIS